MDEMNRDDALNVTSSTESTGFIPALPETDEELEAYKELGSFQGEQAIPDDIKE